MNQQQYLELSLNNNIIVDVENYNKIYKITTFIIRICERGVLELTIKLWGGVIAILFVTFSSLHNYYGGWLMFMSKYQFLFGL